MVLNLCPNCGQVLPDQTSSSGGPSPTPVSSSLATQPAPPIQDDDETPDEQTFTIPPIPPEDIVAQPYKWGSRPPSRPADVQGVVINIQTQNDVQHAPDPVGSFFKAIRDILWPVMETQTRGPDDKTTVTQIRVRVAPQVQRDARMEGTLTGASVALGDTVSLWGRYRKGTLLVQRAYNNTSDAEITTRSGSASNIIVVISVIVLVVAVYFLLSSLQQWPWH